MADERSVPTDAGPRARLKILVLEEDPVFGAHLNGGLTNQGCDVVLIRQGGEGLARAVSERFDAVLVSAELPGVNGFRICNRIKKDENARTTPVFLMSRDSHAASEHRKLPTSADRYFDKPVSLDELSAELRLVLSPHVGAAGIPKGLAQAREQLVALVELERRLTEQERTIADLSAKLAEARASAKAPLPLPSSSGLPPPLPRPSLPVPRPGPTGSIPPDPKRTVRLEKQLAIAHADRELAGRRAKDAIARADNLRSELVTVRAAFEAERAELQKAANAARQAQDAAAAALANERDALAAETAKLRAKVKELEAAAHRARARAEEQASAAASAAESLESARAEVARAKSDAERATSAARDELARIRTRLARELAHELEVESEQMHRRATDEIAEIVSRAGDLVRSIYDEMAKLEQRHDRALEERDAEWKKRLEDALAARASASADEAAAQRGVRISERESIERHASARISEAESRINTLAAEKDAALAAHDKIVKEHAAERASLLEQISTVEALAASRADDLTGAAQAEESARSEIAELEAEIIVLRDELSSVRRKLELTELTARAATDQIEKNRAIVEEATKIVGSPSAGGDGKK